MRTPRLEPRLEDHRFQPQKSDPKPRFQRSEEGFRWPIRTGTGRVLALGMRVAYGVVDVAVGGVGAEFGCGVRERTLGF
ncbi:hypothetical protein F383_12459 [Gossypium arboreum]|uniref:Uncharacterized protein n=1 Tax=Gossypium arboreum TaxID=29729 RepID=A0A0B0PZ37_GOSAR|nr:hypothetical protein F383_12459 [Gossypium arboreum]